MSPPPPPAPPTVAVQLGTSFAGAVADAVQHSVESGARQGGYVVGLGVKAFVQESMSFIDWNDGSTVAIAAAVSIGVLVGLCMLLVCCWKTCCGACETVLCVPVRCLGCVCRLCPCRCGRAGHVRLQQDCA